MRITVRMRRLWRDGVEFYGRVRRRSHGAWWERSGPAQDDVLEIVELCLLLSNGMFKRGHLVSNRHCNKKEKSRDETSMERSRRRMGDKGTWIVEERWARWTARDRTSRRGP